MRVHALPILATMVLGVMLLSGVVLAKSMICHNKCEATNGSDYYVGDDSKNTIYGLAGDDYVGGLGAADMLLGGRDNDKVKGGSGKDSLEGGRGVDKVVGKPGYDILLDKPEKGSFPQLSSQRGAYQVQGGRPDRLLGGEGNDTIWADDGKRDIIRGGPGRDTAYVDPVDDVKGVEEQVEPSGPNKPPVANDDSYSTNKYGYLPVADAANGVLSNDTDADNPNNTSAGLTVTDANPNTPEIDPASGPSNGVLTLNADGSFEYDADLKTPDCFTYTVTDGAADSNVATVKINGGTPPC
jgi:hypothetical protein